jgi:hypothetical protein
MSISLQQLQALVSGRVSNQNLIYNRYQRSDYTVGQDNLNPQRELQLPLRAKPRGGMGDDGAGQGLGRRLDQTGIGLSDAEMWADIENMRARLYDMYRGRLEALRAQAGTTADLPSDLGLSYDDVEQIRAPFTLQESASASRAGAHTPREDIEKMLGALSGLLGGDIISTDDLPFDICAGIYDDFDTFDPSAYDSLRNRGGGNNGAGGGSGGGGGTGGSSKAGAPSGGANAAAQAAISEDMQCFIQELGLLKILLVLIQIMQVAARIQQMVLSVVFMIVRAATLIAQAWVNPTAIAELIQELANMGVSFLAEIIQQIIKAIWDALDLDCLMSTSLAGFREVMGSVATVTDAGAQAKSFLQLNNRAISEVQRTGTLVKDAFASRSLRDVLTDDGTLFSEGVGAASFVRNSPTMTALRSMSAVQKVRSAKAGLAKAWDSGINTPTEIGAGILSEIQQTRSHIAGATAATVGAIGATVRAAQATNLEHRARVGYYHIYDEEGRITETVQLSEAERDQARREAQALRSQESGFLEDLARNHQQALEADIQSISEAVASVQQWSDAAFDTSETRISSTVSQLFGNSKAFDIL